MCEHVFMERVDTLRAQVELWECECGHEEIRIYYGPDGDYTVA